jgi:hypothetical protein
MPKTGKDSAETNQQHTARMRRWLEQDALALKEGRLKPLDSWPTLTRSTASSECNAKKELPAQTLALNHEVAARIEGSDPVTAPAVPKNHPEAKRLMTEDCIRPPGG